MRTVVLKTMEENGVTCTKWEDYIPPQCPPRDFIVEALDGGAVLLTPGQTTLYTRDRASGVMMRSDAPRKGGKGSVPDTSVEYKGYRPLRDRMHATRMTEAEAIEFCRARKWTLHTHRISKEPKRG